MGLPQAVSAMREYKILKRLRVTPVGPVFILGVELTTYIVYCAVSLAVLTIPAALFWHVRGSLLRFLGAARNTEDRQPLPADAGHYDDEERLHRRGYG